MPRHLTYAGQPELASALVQMLEAEGLSVEWTPPPEQRGLVEIGDGVLIGLVVDGAKDAIKTGITAVVAKFRARFPGAAQITDDDEQDGK